MAGNGSAPGAPLQVRNATFAKAGAFGQFVLREARGETQPLQRGSKRLGRAHHAELYQLGKEGRTRPGAYRLSQNARRC